jgi:hypothetical protein
MAATGVVCLSWPGGCSHLSAPAKGSQGGEAPVIHTSEPGPRPRTKTATTNAIMSARTLTRNRECLSSGSGLANYSSQL